MAGLIDVGIIKPELANSFAAGYRGAEQSRNLLAQQKQDTEMGQMKLEQLKNDRMALLQLQDSLKSAGQDPNPVRVFDALIATGNPDYVMKGMDGKRRLTELQRADSVLRQFAPELFQTEQSSGAAPAAAVPAAPAPGSFAADVAQRRATMAPPAAPAPVNAMAPAAPAAGADVNALRRQLTLLSSIDDPRAKALADVVKGQIQEAAKSYVVGGRLVTGAGKELYAAPEAAKLADRFVPVGRLVFDRETQQYISPSQSQLAQSQERPATGGGTRAAPAAPAPKPMTELQQQSSRKAMAADKTSVKNAQSVVGELEKLTDELVGSPEKGIRPDPGLSGITGFQALIPSLPKSDARKAQQKLETMKGKVMAFGRQLASLEGKLGNMAVQEWKFVSDSIQALDPAAGNLDVQLRDIVRQAKNFANTVQERYDLTYEGDGTTGAAPSAAPSRAGGNAPAAGGLSPAEQAELDQLRKRFGK